MTAMAAATNETDHPTAIVGTTWFNRPAANPAKNIGAHQDLAQSRNIKIDHDLGSDSRITSDRSLVSTILGNTVSHSPENSTFSVVTALQSDTIYFAI